MKVKRCISSIPVRSAEDTWNKICELITEEGSVDIEQLASVASVIHSLIADEIFKDTSITMMGAGHRLVIYLRYRQDALEEGEGVDDIQWNPTAGDWKMYVPCDESNLDWVKKSISEQASRIIVHKLDERPYDMVSKNIENSSEELEIDWGVLDG